MLGKLLGARWGERIFLGRKTRISLCRISVLRLKLRPRGEKNHGGEHTNYPKINKQKTTEA